MILRSGNGAAAGEVSLETGRAAMANREDVAELVKQLYEEHFESVYRYLYLSGSASIDADEFVQEAFLRMFQALRGGAHIEKPRNWLLRVVHNLRCDQTRLASRRDEYDEEKLPSAAVIDSAPDPESRAVRQQELAKLRAAMAQLTERQSQFLLLRAEGLKLKDIAEMYGISVQSVAGACERAMDRLGRLTHE
jgi:RNA polymerase sigma-70 factor (ECF subfamily)